MRLSTLPGTEKGTLSILNIAFLATTSEVSFPSTRNFWVHHGAPAAIQESPTRHAIIAIAACFNQRMHRKRDIPFNDLVIERHYNMALRGIRDIISLEGRALNPHELDCILTACICFSALDYVRGNYAAATQHVRHGIMIINTCCPYSDLAGYFRYMSLAPLANVQARRSIPLMSTFGCPYAACNGQCYPGKCTFACVSFNSLGRAQDSLLFAEYFTFRVARLVDDYRAAFPESREWPQHIIQEERKGQAHLREWRVLFSELKANPGSVPEHRALALVLEVRWLISKIHLSTLLEHGDAEHDMHLPEFERIVKLSAQVQSNLSSMEFRMESKLGSFLDMVILKCRYLPYRLKALSLMRDEPSGSDVLLSHSGIHDQVKALVEYDHGHSIKELETMENPPLFPIRPRPW